MQTSINEGKGFLIAIEGIDGVGKNTQSKLLSTTLSKIFNLTDQDLQSHLFSFPDYETFTGRKISDYLDPKSKLNASLFTLATVFAENRLEKKQDILNHLQNNDIVVCDRYVYSNCVYHDSKEKLSNLSIGCEDFILGLEFEINKMPKPDLMFILSMPVNMADILQMKKETRSYTDMKKDINEADASLINLCHKKFNSELSDKAKKYFKNTIIIDCSKGSEIKSINEISNEIVFKSIKYFKEKYSTTFN